MPLNNPFTAAFYKVVMNMQYAGQDIKNILYYRTAIDVFEGAFGIGGAVELAKAIKAQVVPHYVQIMPADAEFQSVTVYPYNNLFQPLYQLPYTETVEEFGGWELFGSSNGPAPCINIKFNLEATLIGSQSLLAPKRGYIAFGPIRDSWVDSDGYLADGAFGPDTDLKSLCDALSTNVSSLTPPAVWFPIRAKVVVSAPGTGGSTVIAYAYSDIMGAVPNRRCSFRRSRLPEA